MRKGLLALCLAVCLTVCVGCAAPEETALTDQLPQHGDTAEEPQPVRTGIGSFSLPWLNGATLDPITCPDGPNQTIGALLYEGLFALDGQFAPQPMLAESYVYDAGEKLYAFTLRGGVTFSDGSPLTAEDAAASLERARTSTRYGARLTDVNGINAVGQTVYVSLSQPDGSLPARLDIPIVKAGTESDAVPAGTGRYVWAEDGDGPCLTVNSRSWRHQKLPFSRIGLTPCEDDEAVSYAFFAHDIQFLTCDLIGTAAGPSVGGSYFDVPTATMQYIGFNTGAAPFSDPALRAAVSTGFDRSRCVNNCLLGHGLPAQFPLSPASGLYPADLDVDYSAEDYTARMAEAGYDNGNERAVTMLVSAENSFRVQAARQIAAELSCCDLKITVSELPWADFLKALQEGKYDLYYAECRLTADWDLTALLGEKGNLNVSHYRDDALSTLLGDAAAATGDHRAAAVEALCGYLRRQAPITPVCFKNASVLLPSGAVDPIAPTAADPFYDLSSWNVHWLEDTP